MGGRQRGGRSSSGMQRCRIAEGGWHQGFRELPGAGRGAVEQQSFAPSDDDRQCRAVLTNLP